MQLVDKYLIRKSKYTRYEDWRSNNFFLLNGRLMFGADLK
jgi:hypothetical protein